MSGAPASPAAETGTGQSPVTTRTLETHVLRCCRDLTCSLIGAEAEQRRDTAGAIQIGMFLEVEQFDVATDGDGDDGVRNVAEFASEASARDARGHQMGVDVAAVRTLARFSGLVIA